MDISFYKGYDRNVESLCSFIFGIHDESDVKPNDETIAIRERFEFWYQLSDDLGSCVLVFDDISNGNQFLIACVSQAVSVFDSLRIEHEDSVSVPVMEFMGQE